MADPIREELDRLLDKAADWPGHYNLEVLGGFLVEHPELVGRTKTARQIADAAYRTRRRREAEGTHT